ncbi:MAG: transporter [Hydrocarboniphaga sp.]|uniref:spinster family MFS transporter n=1 Tax=Hydrocarboniphaga sp. TaxID=2033016 RepID=UPI002620AFE7|nr:MFS transporter [Hydrocarboniphaga sp.]MDB5968617.1 transporter [Hydrocarboniphaga sp.]
MTAVETSTPVAATLYPSPAAGWYATIVLALLYWFSVLDRFIIGLMVDPIKRDLGLTDLQFGILTGSAFAITFSVVGLLAGALADRFNRRWVIYVGVTIWSLATAACGFAQSYWHMLLARVGVGAGEAALNPCATSMITDLFPRHRLTTALAVYAMGSTVGSGCAYLFGGLIVTLVSKSATFELPLVGAVRSWQAAFFIVGVPGALVSLLIFAVPEPLRRGTRAAQRRAGLFWRDAVGYYLALIRFMRGRGRFFLYHYTGFGLASLIVSGCQAWYPAYIGRSFGWKADKIGLYMGVTLVISGVVGKLIGGLAVDAMYRRGMRDAQFRWYGAALLAATPLGLIAFTAGSPWMFLGFISLFLVVLSPFIACANAALNLVTPNELRGTGVAFFNGTAGLVGLAGGPILVAALSDHVFNSSANSGSSLGLGLAAATAICCPVAALLLFCGMKAMRRAVDEAETSA